MKKIITLLTVSLLLVALCVPAFASEDVPSVYAYRTFLTPGDYFFPEVVDMSWATNTNGVVQVEDPGIVIGGQICTYFYRMSQQIYAGSTFDDKLLLYSPDTGWTDDAYRYWTVTQTVGTMFPYEFVSQMQLLECDGSSCPATDLNHDYICDDCGAPFAMSLRKSVEVVVKHSETLTLLYRYTETVFGTDFNAVYDDSRVTVSFDNPVNHTQYKLVDGEWELYATHNNEYGSHALSLSSGASILSSDVDVYNADGTLFFQNPLWMRVEQVTQGVIPELSNNLGGTMMILIVCGVGCLALLIVLNLFGKRLSIFRS